MTENVKADENLTRYQNVHYKSDIEYAILIARTLLTPIGVWPLHRGDSLMDKIKTFLHIGAIFGLICILLVPHVIYTYHDLEDLTVFLKLITGQLFSLLVIIKFWTIVANRQGMRLCLREMEAHYRNVENEDDRELMMKSAKIGRMFTTLYLGLSYGGGLPYHIVLPLMSEKIAKEDNTTHIPLPYPSNYIFFTIEGSPMFEITYTWQIMISSIIVSTNCGIYSLIATITMHSCGLFEIVNRKIETFLGHDQSELRDRLNGVVQHHVRAIEFAGMLEKALNIMFLTEMIGSTIIVCFLEYGVLTEWKNHKTINMMTYFVLIMSVFLNVYIISFIGDRLKYESERVAETSYSMLWYDFPGNVMKDVRMIILRTSRPTNLTAGKLADLSLRGFCDVCKTSMAYLNFLRAMTI